MTVLADPDLIPDSWAMQARWSLIAGKFKRQLDGWRAAAALAGVVGAILITAAASLSAYGDQVVGLRTMIALLGAAVLAIVPIAVSQTRKDQVQDWVRARSASEGLKEQIWRFLAGGPPYGQQRDARVFNIQRDNLVSAVHDLVPKAGSVRPQTQSRPIQPLAIDQFIAQRLDDQVKNYYGKNSDKNARTAGFWRNVGLGLGIVAAIAGAVSGGTAGGFKFDVPAWLSGIGPWVAVLTTATAAVTAHVNAQRFDELAVNYAATGAKLLRLRTDFRNDPDKDNPERIVAFIDDVEKVISSENEGWRTTMTEEKQ